MTLTCGKRLWQLGRRPQQRASSVVHRPTKWHSGVLPKHVLVPTAPRWKPAER